MPGMGIAAASAPASQVAASFLASFLGLGATFWAIVAILGWLVVLVVFVEPIRRPLQRALIRFPRAQLRSTLERFRREEDDPAERILGWLARETEAEAVAYLELSPAAEEYLRTAPRGLTSDTVAELAQLARRALVEPRAEDAEVVRWLGPGGSRVLVASGTLESSAEPMRFARYMLASQRAEGAGSHQTDLEERLRGVTGVAWAEVRPGRVRLLTAERASGAAVKETVSRILRRRMAEVEWVGEVPAAVPTPSTEPLVGDEAEPTREPVPGVGLELAAGASAEEEPRIKLLEVLVSEDGDITADVRVTWKEHEIRGRGRGRAGPSGRYFAAAQAVADALRPLLDTDIEVAGLYAAQPHEGVHVIIAEVLLEGQRYVGAVMERPEERDWTGARAILDAVNRRLTQVAGRSGRV